MPEVKEYAPGTPSWVDLGSPDLEASKRFYRALFGWNAETGDDPATGGYTVFTLRGKNAAGLAPLMAPGQPPAWTTYVSVDDADTAAKTALAAGGSVLAEPVDVLDIGRMAVFADPTGAVVSVWQPRAHIGADLANEPGTFCWNELATRDTEAAKPFYRAVFGWEGETNVDAGMAYTEWKLDGRSVAGMMDMGAQVPADVPPHWLVYFAVDDCDASVDTAQANGAGVFVPPSDVPPGRFSVLTDPHGAVFAVIRMTT